MNKDANDHKPNDNKIVDGWSWTDCLQRALNCLDNKGLMTYS